MTPLVFQFELDANPGTPGELSIVGFGGKKTCFDVEYTKNMHLRCVFTLWCMCTWVMITLFGGTITRGDTDPLAQYTTCETRHARRSCTRLTRRNHSHVTHCCRRARDGNGWRYRLADDMLFGYHCPLPPSPFNLAGRCVRVPGRVNGALRSLFPK